MAGWAAMPTTWASARYSATSPAENSRSCLRYTGRKALMAPCPMLRSAAIATRACIFRSRRSVINDAMYGLSDVATGGPPDNVRMTPQITSAPISAGTMLTWSTPRQASPQKSDNAIRVSIPAAASGPITSPTLPPVPWSEMAKPRLSGKRRESDDIAGGWYREGPNPINRTASNSTP